MTPQAQLLMTVAEDLRRTDAAAHDALMLAAQQGCTTLLQIELGRQAQLSVGFRDDYNVTRWVHAIPLH